jgi:hypothetical protein
LRAASGLAALIAAAILAPTPVQAGQHKTHRHAGVKGVVLDSTCYGACPVPRPPEPVYKGSVTIEVRRADGTEAARKVITDGQFKLRVKPGIYDVSSVPPSSSPQPCPTGQACPYERQARPAVIAQCLQGETKRVRVRRHRFRHVDLHVTNTCIV